MNDSTPSASLATTAELDDSPSPAAWERGAGGEGVPPLLALETTGDVCGVALYEGAALRSEHTFRHGMHLSERLLDHVEAVLQDGGITLEGVATFAVGIGPGSFTGTRIGVMTAKTWAALFQKPLVGVGSLEALAFEYAGCEETLVVPILPCRKEVVYACAYDVAGAVPNALGEPQAHSLDELTETIKGLGAERVLLCGAAVERYGETLQARWRSEGVACALGAKRFPSVTAVATLAAHRLSSSAPTDDPMTLVPLYISPPPISTPKTPIPQGNATGRAD